MDNVIPIGKRRRPPGSGSARPAARGTGAGGDTLCRNGHHRWKVCKQLPFDVRQGRLVTLYRCERCGKQRSTAS